jgi:hypothetical protein
MKQQLKPDVLEINRLQELVIVNCYIYYVYDSSVLNDSAFDYCCRMLIARMNSKDAFNSKHYELFKEFNMSTRYLIVKPDCEKWKKIALEVIKNDKYIAY